MVIFVRQPVIQFPALYNSLSKAHNQRQYLKLACFCHRDTYPTGDITNQEVNCTQSHCSWPKQLNLRCLGCLRCVVVCMEMCLGTTITAYYLSYITASMEFRLKTAALIPIREWTMPNPCTTRYGVKSRSGWSIRSHSCGLISALLYHFILSMICFSDIKKVKISLRYFCHWLMSVAKRT